MAPSMQAQRKYLVNPDQLRQVASVSGVPSAEFARLFENANRPAIPETVQSLAGVSGQFQSTAYSNPASGHRNRSTFLPATSVFLQMYGDLPNRNLGGNLESQDDFYDSHHQPFGTVFSHLQENLWGFGSTAENTFGSGPLPTADTEAISIGVTHNGKADQSPAHFIQDDPHMSFLSPQFPSEQSSIDDLWSINNNRYGSTLPWEYPLQVVPSQESYYPESRLAPPQQRETIRTGLESTSGEASPEEIGSSWLYLTPPSSDGSAVVVPSPSLLDPQPCPQPIDPRLFQAAMTFPCSHVWPSTHEEPPNHQAQPVSAQRTTSHFRSGESRLGQNKRTRSKSSDRHAVRRAAFQNPQNRENAARTRNNHACIRCRFQKTTCEPDPDDESGPCLTCERVKRGTATRLPCMRYIVTNASVYRHQDKPYQLFSKRWQSMDLVDIDEWRSNETKTIELSQVFLNAPFKLEVREFEPREGDMLSELWQDGNVTHTHKIPPYAMANLQIATELYKAFVDKNIGPYISGVIDERSLGPSFFETYEEAMRFRSENNTSQEGELIYDTLRLWVVCRICSNPHRIISTETLGALPITNRASPQYGSIPMPPIMIAQQELIMFTHFLRPLSKHVLKRLQDLVYANKRRSWYTIYLVLFMLLHSCSLMTRRDYEYARQIKLEGRYANARAIEDHHSGCQTMLAHFHYINKGDKPFVLALDPGKYKYFKEEAELTEHQAQFILRTAQNVRDLEPVFKRVRDESLYEHDCYWIAQLYDTDWRPRTYAY